MMWSLVIGVGATILFILAIIAILMWIKVFRLEALKKAELQEQERLGDQKIAQHRIKLNKDIKVVAQAFLNGELSPTETALRLGYMLDQLGVDAVSHSQFAVILELREKTQHIPILAKWRALTLKEQRAFDQERLAVEVSLHDGMYKAVNSIKEVDF